MQGLFGQLQNGKQAAVNAAAGIISGPANQIAEFTPYLGIGYGNGSVGTSDWFNKTGIFGKVDNNALSSKVGGLLGTAAIYSMMGRNFDKNAAAKAIAFSMLKDSALSFLKDRAQT